MDDDSDRWTRRARPAFLYVIYALLLWSVPMGLVAGWRPDVAAASTGYLGYTAARAWGKAKGVEK